MTIRNGRSELERIVQRERRNGGSTLRRSEHGKRVRLRYRVLVTWRLCLSIQFECNVAMQTERSDEEMMLLKKTAVSCFAAWKGQARTLLDQGLRPWATAPVSDASAPFLCTSLRAFALGLFHLKRRLLDNEVRNIYRRFFHSLAVARYFIQVHCS